MKTFTTNEFDNIKLTFEGLDRTCQDIRAQFSVHTQMYTILREEIGELQKDINALWSQLHHTGIYKTEMTNDTN